MIVEFIGASGSGKTSLARAVARTWGDDDAVITAWDLVLEHVHPPGVSARMTNVVADLYSIKEMVRLGRKHRAFLAYAVGRLRNHRPIRLQTLNYCRSVVRRLGVDQLARRNASGRVVLVDEGTMLAAYLLFVYGNCEFDHEDLVEFTEMVPQPDCIVHVRAPLLSVIERTQARSDPPRELRGLDRRELGIYRARAADMFGSLMAAPTLRSRFIEVENVAGTKSEREMLAADVAASLKMLVRPETSSVEVIDLTRTRVPG